MRDVRVGTYASLCTVIIAVVLIAGTATGDDKEPQPAGVFEIPAWIFDKGNARVIANPDMYADYRDTYPELVVTAGDEMPWVVEYELDFPVDATYTLHVRYASTESRPLALWLDGERVGECCKTATLTREPHPYLTANPHFKPPKGSRVRRGAKWEEAGKITIKSGKHTLKLTCNGPVPNVLALRLESPVAFPKDWKMIGLGVVLSQRQVAERYRYRTRHELGWPHAVLMEKINRLPPRYRTAFLPPNSVNVAALRLAIEDTTSRFGASYPNGSDYLKQLAMVTRRQAGADNATLEQKQEIEDALQSLRSEAMFAHPLLDFDKLLFVRRHPLKSGHIYEDHCAGGRMGGNLCLLSPVVRDGKVTELVPELSGGLFAQFDLSFDAKKVVFAHKKGQREPYRIYEIDLDPATGLRAGGDDFRQLTFDAPDEAETKQLYGNTHWGRGFDDVFPCYLPNGKIMFASSRSKRSVFCAPVTVTTLHVMDADGKNIRCLSEGPVTEIAPRVMHDGRVIYMRWEYVDKGFGNLQSLWSMRPDGSHSAHVYKNDIVLPAGMVDARSIPGSSRIVTVGAPHCGMSVGPVILVDNRLDRRTAVSMTNITPELGYPGMVAHRSGRTFGYFKEPFPLSEKIFVVSHSPGGQKGNSQSYGLYILDAWGNRTALYRDPEISCFQPTPLRPRHKPMMVASVGTDKTSKEQKLGTIFMQDVYRGMTGIERGSVKYLRVMEAIGISWDEGFRSSRQRDGAGLQASAVSLKADVNIKKIHGVATVYEDGSACFTVPAEKNIFFQALDENYMELQRMRTFINLMPGEKRSCIGCHERRQLAPSPASGRPLALGHTVETLRPQPGDSKPRTVHYAADIRPLLDRCCVSCHGSEEPKGGLDLTGGLTKLYDRSYENFIEKGLLGHLNDGYGSANVAPEPPMTFGSHQSRLIKRISEAPCKANLTREEFIRIVTWVDANAPYFGTHRGKKNIQWNGEPDFRPLPLVSK